MDFSMFELTDRVAIVTGAGSGLGRAIALQLARAGANVIVAGISINDRGVVADTSQSTVALDNTTKQIRALGRKALSIITDVRESAQVDNMVQKTMEKFGHIDILVNNAGTDFFKEFLKLSERSWDAMINANLKSTFLCTRAVAPIMVNQKKGNIINIASIVGIVGGVQRVPYGAAKAGIINFTKTLAVELGDQGIRVNCIAPGAILTEGMKSMRSEENLAKMARRVPLLRLGTPEDIALTALYFAADASDYVTGQTLLVDSGISQNLARV